MWKRSATPLNVEQCVTACLDRFLVEVLGRHLLSDPESISALMQILQDAKSFLGEENALCVECVRFLRLVTAHDGDVRTIVAFQDGAEDGKMHTFRRETVIIFTLCSHYFNVNC